MSTPYNTGRVRIGSRFEQPQRAQETTYSQDQVQRALLAWQARSANDSRILGAGGDCHPAAELLRIERERHRARRVRKWRKVWRDFVAMLLSPKAPRVWR